MSPRHSSSNLIPIPELTQDVGHAAEAHLLHAGLARDLAEPDRRAQRIARAGVVPGHLERRSEPLIDLRRLTGELVLQRQRQSAPNRRDALVG